MADYTYDAGILATLLDPNLGITQAMGDNGGGPFTQMPAYNSQNGGANLMSYLRNTINVDTPGSGDSNPGYGDQELLLQGIQRGLITPEQASQLLVSKTPYQNVQASEADIASLAGLLAPNDYSVAAQNAGLQEVDIERQIAGDMARMGVTDPSKIGVTTNDYGDTFYYNTETGQQLPSYFGSDTSGEDQRRFHFQQNPDGTVGVRVENRTSSSWETVRDVATMAAVMGGAYYAGGQLAAGQAAGAAGGAGAAEAGTGLSTLPTGTGTWAHVGAPAATQGAWTAPEALTGVAGFSGATGEGMTLADSLANTYAADPAMANVAPGGGYTQTGGGPGYPNGAETTVYDAPPDAPSTPNPSTPNKPTDPGIQDLVNALMPKPAGTGGLGGSYGKPVSYNPIEAQLAGNHLRSLGQILGGMR